MGTLSIAPVTIKKLHKMGSELTIKMFRPNTHNVSSKNTRIAFGKDNSFLEPSMDSKYPRETWQVVNGLNTYTLVVNRVWPEDWIGLALQHILVIYRWLANCGKSKVLYLNASRRRSSRHPFTYKEIKECMSP